MDDFLEFIGCIAGFAILFFALASAIIFSTNYTLGQSQWGCTKLEKGVCAQYSHMPVIN